MTDPLSKELAALRIDRESPPRGSSPIRFVVGAATVVAIGLAVYRFGWPELEARAFKTDVEVTEIAQVSPAQALVELTSTGYVVPQVVSKVAAKVPGKVSEVWVKQGDSVKAGVILFQIDPSDAQAGILAARAQAAAARARALTARANLAETRQQAERDRALAAEGLAPQATAQDRTARGDALEESAKASEAEVEAALSQVKTLEVNLKSYTVKSPISGVVLNKPPQVGEFVGPQPAGIAADMGGVEVADFSSLMVETDVPEPRLHQLKLGAPCEIVLDAFPTQRFRGKLLEITPKVNRAKATVTVKVGFGDENKGVLPDMSARVSFLTAELDLEALKIPPKTIVPGNALTDLDGTKVIYVVDDGKVRVTPVTLGPSFGGGFELVKGPPPGTRVVKSPPLGLADGQRVKERS